MVSVSRWRRVRAWSPSRFRILFFQEMHEFFASFRWVLPIIPALLAVAYEIDTQHTYPNPLHPDHARLAADRVVEPSEKEYRNVLAAQYGDWVLNYARQPRFEGRRARPQRNITARHCVCRPGDRKAFLRLKELEGKAEAVVESERGIAVRPFWSDGEEIALVSQIGSHGGAAANQGAYDCHYPRWQHSGSNGGCRRVSASKGIECSGNDLRSQDRAAAILTRPQLQ